MQSKKWAGVGKISEQQWNVIRIMGLQIWIRTLEYDHTQIARLF